MANIPTSLKMDDFDDFDKELNEFTKFDFKIEGIGKLDSDIKIPELDDLLDNFDKEVNQW